MRHLFPLLLLAFSCDAPNEATPDPKAAPDTTGQNHMSTLGTEHLLARLQGHWTTPTDSDGTVFHELWRTDPNGRMTGIGCVLAGTDTVFIEHLAIHDTDSGLVYDVDISETDGAAFLLSPSGPDSLLFLNPAHDFPQRVLYVPEGDGWHAQVDGVVNGKVREEHFHLRPLNATP